MPDRNNQFENLMNSHLSGIISDNEERIFVDILNSDPRYKTLYREMAKTRALSFIPVLESEKKDSHNKFTNALHNRVSFNRKSNPFYSFLKIAAAMIFIASTSISSYYIFAKQNNQLTTCETFVPFGSQAKIILPDGTVAWLNSGSTLKYNNSFGRKDREVQLTGEGYFEVTKNKSKPFMVQANNIKIKVLGTVFNVRSYLDAPTIEVNLLEGKVDVTKLNMKDARGLTLLPNEKMIYDRKAGTMFVCKADAAKSAQWTTGKLCFVDASLKDISKDLERKFDVQIKLETEDINKEIFSGSLDLNQPLDKILDYLDVDKKFTKTHNGKTIYIKNKKTRRI